MMPIARRARWPAKKLFSLFDVGGDGAIQADEFRRTQLEVATALSEMADEGGLLGGPLLGHAAPNEDVSAPTTLPSMPRGMLLSRLQRARFQEADTDGDGVLGFEEFKRWVRQATTTLEKQHLIALACKLERRRAGSDLAKPGRPWWLHCFLWEAFGRWEASAHHRRQAARDRRAPDAQAAWLRRFPVSINSLSGATCTVEVWRRQTVAELRHQVGSALGKSTGCLVLAHVGGCLAPPAATLEECGVTGPEVQIAVSFVEFDPPWSKKGIDISLDI